MEVVDSLALLSLKVAPNVFDLSSGMNHVSIRDQIVRAQLVVRDLKRADPGLQSLLIIGAGIAGIFAALAAADLDISTVVVVDVADQPFSLLRGVTQRHVGPFMYEWPSPFFNDQSYPAHSHTPWSISSPSPLCWSSAQPCSADDFATKLTQELDSRLNTGYKRDPEIYLSVPKAAIQSFVRTFARIEAIAARNRLRNRGRGPRAVFDQTGCLDYKSRSSGSIRISPQYVLLASGMGREDCELVKTDDSGSLYTGPNFTGQHFWDNDHLLNGPTANKTIYIFGGGDGAMQDALRALTGYEHPLRFLQDLQQDPHTQSIIDGLSAQLLALDRQGRQYATWTRGAEAYEALDAGCKKLAEQLASDPHIQREVVGALRQGAGSVSLFVREGHFGKAYLLNRFLIYLIDTCCRRLMFGQQNRMTLSLHFSHQPVGYEHSGIHEVSIQNLTTGRVDLHFPDEIVVRYGIERHTAPGAQMIQVSDRPSRQRTTLARVELPFVAG